MSGDRAFITASTLVSPVKAYAKLANGHCLPITSPFVLKGSYMKKPDEEFNLNLRSRAKEAVTIEIPKDTLDSLKKVAASRNMSVEALLKLYIGRNYGKT